MIARLLIRDGCTTRQMGAPRTTGSAAGERDEQKMTPTGEIVLAILERFRASEDQLLVPLGTDDPDDAADIIGEAVAMCTQMGAALAAMSIDPRLARELGLRDGEVIPQGCRPIVRIEPGLGSQLRLCHRLAS